LKLLSWLLFRLLIIVDAGVTKASSSAGFQFCLASQLSLCLKEFGCLMWRNNNTSIHFTYKPTPREINQPFFC